MVWKLVYCNRHCSQMVLACNAFATTTPKIIAILLAFYIVLFHLEAWFPQLREPLFLGPTIT